MLSAEGEIAGETNAIVKGEKYYNTFEWYLTTVTGTFLGGMVKRVPAAPAPLP